MWRKCLVCYCFFSICNRCLHKSAGCLQYRPVKCAQLILCCARLHNLCVDNGIANPEPINDEDDDTSASSIHMPDAHAQGQTKRQSIINLFQWRPSVKASLLKCQVWGIGSVVGSNLSRVWPNTLKLVVVVSLLMLRSRGQYYTWLFSVSIMCCGF